jgi:hypothetical protein
VVSLLRLADPRDHAHCSGNVARISGTAHNGTSVAASAASATVAAVLLFLGGWLFLGVYWAIAWTLYRVGLRRVPFVRGHAEENDHARILVLPIPISNVTQLASIDDADSAAPSYAGRVQAHVPSASQRLKPMWLALCLVLGAGLGLWSLYLIGLLIMLWISVAVAANQRSQSGARATLIALTVGYETALATLVVLYRFVWDEGSAPYLYVGVLAAAGLMILGSTLWWREHHRQRA